MYVWIKFDLSLFNRLLGSEDDNQEGNVNLARQLA